MAKHLTDEDGADIERKWIAGSDLIEICKEYNVGIEAVKNRLRKRGWAKPMMKFDREKCLLTDYQRGYREGFEAGRNTTTSTSNVL